MFCTSCGSQVLEGQEYCIVCGERVSHFAFAGNGKRSMRVDAGAPTPPPSMPAPWKAARQACLSSKKGKRLAIAAVASVMVAALLAGGTLGYALNMTQGSTGSTRNQGAAVRAVGTGNAEEQVSVSARNAVESYSWDELATISDAIAVADSEKEALEIAKDFNLVNSKGKLDGKQTKNVTLANGDVVEAQIVGFVHDARADGGKAGITFMFKDCVSDRAFNESGSNSGGWRQSDLRAWMNGELVDELPDDLRCVLVNVYKSSNNEGKTGSPSSVTTTSDLLWAPSFTEIVGHVDMDSYENAYEQVDVSRRAEFQSYFDVWNAEGSQYKLYRDQKVCLAKPSRTLEKSSPSGSPRVWWGRSSSPGEWNKVQSVSSEGEAQKSSSSPDEWLGAAPCFCIGRYCYPQQQVSDTYYVDNSVTNVNPVDVRYVQVNEDNSSRIDVTYIDNSTNTTNNIDNSVNVHNDIDANVDVDNSAEAGEPEDETGQEPGFLEGLFGPRHEAVAPEDADGEGEDEDDAEAADERDHADDGEEDDSEGADWDFGRHDDDADDPEEADDADAQDEADDEDADEEADREASDEAADRVSPKRPEGPAGGGKADDGKRDESKHENDEHDAISAGTPVNLTGTIEVRHVGDHDAVVLVLPEPIKVNDPKNGTASSNQVGLDSSLAKHGGERVTLRCALAVNPDGQTAPNGQTRIHSSGDVQIVSAPQGAPSKDDAAAAADAAGSALNELGKVLDGEDD